MRTAWICLALVMLAACTASDPGAPAITIEQPWARATTGAAPNGAVYAVIRNAGGADRLLSVASPASASAELHQTTHVGQMAQMRPVESLEVPARGQLVLEPGGLHLMLNGLQSQLLEGQNVPVTFVFEQSGSIEIQAQVLPIDALGAAAQAASQTEHHH